MCKERYDQKPWYAYSCGAHEQRDVKAEFYILDVRRVTSNKYGKSIGKYYAR